MVNVHACAAMNLFIKMDYTIAVDTIKYGIVHFVF